MRKKHLSLFLILFLFLGCKSDSHNHSVTVTLSAWDKLSEADHATLDSVLAHWETWVPARKADGSAPLMAFKELYQGLNQTQSDFLDRVRAIKPSDLDFDPAIHFKKILGQQITRGEKLEVLPPQYLPQNVYEAYLKMMSAMKKDLGRRLYVESGYRSPAYQLYTFLYYCPKHHYSLKETNEWVALPGHSEHGNPAVQAIDFINEQGINGDSDFGQTAADFDVLPEFQWLQQNAHLFGFELSYPKGHKTTTYEPWHWRFRQI